METLNRYLKISVYRGKDFDNEDYKVIVIHREIFLLQNKGWNILREKIVPVKLIDKARSDFCKLK